MNIALAQLVEMELDRPEIQSASVTDESVIVDLQDGRTLIVPILWYPRLAYAKVEERQNLEINRNVIRWPEIDEEINVRGMLLGRKSGESAESLQRWLAGRRESVQN